MCCCSRFVISIVVILSALRNEVFASSEVIFFDSYPYSFIEANIKLHFVDYLNFTKLTISTPNGKETKLTKEKENFQESGASNAYPLVYPYNLGGGGKQSDDEDEDPKPKPDHTYSRIGFCPRCPVRGYNSGCELAEADDQKNALVVEYEVSEVINYNYEMWSTIHLIFPISDNVFGVWFEYDTGMICSFNVIDIISTHSAFKYKTVHLPFEEAASQKVVIHENNILHIPFQHESNRCATISLNDIDFDQEFNLPDLVSISCECEASPEKAINIFTPHSSDDQRERQLSEDKKILCRVIHPYKGIKVIELVDKANNDTTCTIKIIEIDEFKHQMFVVSFNKGKFYISYKAKDSFYVLTIEIGDNIFKNTVSVILSPENKLTSCFFNDLSFSSFVTLIPAPFILIRTPEDEHYILSYQGRAIEMPDRSIIIYNSPSSVTIFYPKLDLE